MRDAPLLRCAAALGVLLLASSCDRSGGDLAMIVDEPIRCGVTAAMGPNRDPAVRERPPACALPTPKEVASSCAIYDLVRKPGYRPAETDEMGTPFGGDPVPEYRVTDVACDFTTPARNEALCRFHLLLPGETGPGSAKSIAFEHRFWADHGPAHHLYGTSWWPLALCAGAAS